MTNILLAVYFNNLVRILWHDLEKINDKVCNGSAICNVSIKSVLMFEILPTFLRAIIWPIVLVLQPMVILINHRISNKGA